jgi:hypothetical protein
MVSELKKIRIEKEKLSVKMEELCATKYVHYMHKIDFFKYSFINIYVLKF